MTGWLITTQPYARKATKKRRRKGRNNCIKKVKENLGTRQEKKLL
jgi:hypothetical protein